jgi:hypothetical protein
MSPRESPHEAEGRSAFVKSVWDRIRTHLVSEKHRIYEEIRNYPRPVAGCDQQFNYLLEERARISAELERMDRDCVESLTRGNPLELVEEFIRSSAYLNQDAAWRIRSHLEERSARQER